MRRFPTELQHALAAEYVLGTLRGRARARFEALTREDRSLAAVVRAWEDYLTPLSAALAPVEPPARVWKNILARIAPRAHVAPAGAQTGFWSSVGFWRALGGGLAVVVVALLVTLAGKPTAPAAPGMVAVLATPEQDPRMIVEQHAGMLKVRIVKAWKPVDTQDLELWVIPKDGKPRSLGVVGADRDTDIRLANLDVKLQEGVAFAISREPKGGSPTGGPTGPVLCSGVIARSVRA
jgi:anti-sigma-K factor RskA